MTDKQATTDNAETQVKPQMSDERPYADSASAADQQELWRRYLEQQARRSCPGCGEAGDALL